MQAIRDGNKSGLIRFSLIAGVGVGFFVAGFSVYELIDQCGWKFVVPLLTGLLFSGNSLFFLRQPWKFMFLILGCLCSLAVLIISIVFIVQVSNQSVCSYMWCLSSSYDSSTVVAKFPSSYCSGLSAQQIGNIMIALANILEGSTSTTVYYFSQAVAIIVEVILMIISLIHTITFGLAAFVKRKE